MIFKSPELQDELAHTPTLLQVMAEWFSQLSISHFSIDPVVTRVLEKVEGSSGIHEAGKAIDFRNEHAGKYLYTDEQVDFLVNAMNERFPRTDNKLTCIHHRFNNGMAHVHIQMNSEKTKDLGITEV